MDGSVNIINWFEVYVDDLSRAQAFYEEIFQVRLEVMDFGALTMALFPADSGNGKVSGALVRHEMRKPGDCGTLLYFNANPDLSAVLGRVEAAGGKINRPKTKISDEVGYMALFTDTEGNGMALHSLA